MRRTSTVARVRMRPRTDRVAVSPIGRRSRCRWLRSSRARTEGRGSSGIPRRASWRQLPRRLAWQRPSPSPPTDSTDVWVLLVLEVLEAERRKDTRGWVPAGQCVRDDVVDLAAGDGMVDQRLCGGCAEPSATEVGSDLVADLDRPPCRRGREAAGADELTGRVVEEELHRPRLVCVRRVAEVLQVEVMASGNSGQPFGTDQPIISLNSEGSLRAFSNGTDAATRRICGWVDTLHLQWRCPVRSREVGPSWEHPGIRPWACCGRQSSVAKLPCTPSVQGDAGTTQFAIPPRAQVQGRRATCAHRVLRAGCAAEPVPGIPVAAAGVR